MTESTIWGWLTWQSYFCGLKEYHTTKSVRLLASQSRTSHLFAAPFKYIAILEIYVLALTSVYILFYKKYDFNMILSFDVLNASRMMKKFKKSYTHMIFISWSVAIAILVSFCPMIIKAWSTPLKAICAISFLVIVLFVCLFLEYHYSKKIIDSCDSIIKRLDNCNE